MRKRILGITLAFCLLFACLPSVGMKALAAEPTVIHSETVNVDFTKFPSITIGEPIPSSIVAGSQILGTGKALSFADTTGIEEVTGGWAFQDSGGHWVPVTSGSTYIFQEGVTYYIGIEASLTTANYVFDTDHFNTTVTSSSGNPDYTILNLTSRDLVVLVKVGTVEEIQSCFGKQPGGKSDRYLGAH